MKRSYIQAILLLTFIVASIINANGQNINRNPYPDTLNNKRLTTVLIAETVIYAGGFSFLEYIWYNDVPRVPFHYYDDSDAYLQMDKVGHAMTAYLESSASYYALRWAGIDKAKALIFGGSAGLLLQTPIEIYDGLYEGWGFSWTDMIANITGPTLFVLQEGFFDEQIIRPKFSYYPSEYRELSNELGKDPPIGTLIFDYNAHTYWLSANLNSITGIEKIPDWLNLAVGYSGEGIIKGIPNPDTYTDNPFPEVQQYRQFLLSLDVDWLKVKTDKSWLRRLYKALNLIKIPFPALELNGKGEFKFRPLYF